MSKPKGIGARILLATLGGLAALVAGYNEHYYADRQTSKRQHKRPRLSRGKYGLRLRQHFDRVGINWSSKRNGKFNLIHKGW